MAKQRGSSDKYHNPVHLAVFFFIVFHGMRYNAWLPGYNDFTFRPRLKCHNQKKNGFTDLHLTRSHPTLYQGQRQTSPWWFPVLTPVCKIYMKHYFF